MSRHLILLALCLALATAANGLTRTYANTQEFSAKYKFYWSVENDEVAIGLVVQTTGWVGFGIAEQISGSMRGGDIVTASVSNGTTTIVDRYATEHELPSPDSDCQSWTLIAGSESGGFTSVELRRKLDTGDSQDRPIPPGRVRVLWAFGQNDTVAYHEENKGPTVVIFYGAQDTPQVNGTDVQTIQLTNENFTVPNISTYYSCRTFALPFTTANYIIAAEPIISAASAAYVHHFAVVWCTANDSFVQQHYNTDNCFGPFGKIASSCQTAIFGWGPHAEGQTVYLPEDVGMKMGPGAITIIEVQVHFNNYDGRADIVDSSGVKLYYTATPRKYNAGVLTLGDPTISALPIPAGVSSWDFQSECPSECTGAKWPHNITIFAGYNHAHHLAKSCFTSIWRDGSFLTYVGRAEFYDFNFQQTAMEDVVVMPGDRLMSHCVYDSTGMNMTTTFGLATENEMCTVMLFYYPQIDNFSFCGYGRLNKTDPVHNITYCGVRQASDTWTNMSNPIHPDSADRIVPLFGQANDVSTCQITPTTGVMSTTGSMSSATTGSLTTASMTVSTGPSKDQGSSAPAQQVISSFFVALLLALVCL